MDPDWGLAGTDLGRKGEAVQTEAKVKLDVRRMGFDGCNVSLNAGRRGLLKLSESISCAYFLLNVKMRGYQFP